MTGTYTSMGPHDVGGEEAGPIDTEDHGMTHWEKHANALRMTAVAKKFGTLDELRRATEGLGARYYEIGYFERQTESLAIILAEKDLVADDALKARMEDIAARFDVPIIDLPKDHDHHGKPIKEDETGEGPNQHHLMNLAMQELLQDQNLITADDIRSKIEKFEDDYPNRGAKVVAQAWTDADFMKRLLEDANPVIEDMGIDLEHASRIIAIENTAEVHNVIVCTLCSCYPRTLMGQPPTWYKSRSYRSRVIFEPRAVLKEFGTEIDDNVVIRTHDSNADMRYIVIPMRPGGTDNWSQEQLEAIISRDSLVGITVLADQ
ncbi:MAG: Low-molecular weight cobalt-containing nitrile hydratase subunit alpha [Alphaproteobacteria bacterium MarineAlpha3_Bin2]|jgi:nitrile hydratase|nr:MAG: Low-molecular weight cobalt-containing nitrile hydratase subunit alpha [Alphaproteobacteria bacterium MarineAlpha3_Bin2]